MKHKFIKKLFSITMAATLAILTILASGLDKAIAAGNNQITIKKETVNNQPGKFKYRAKASKTYNVVVDYQYQEIGKVRYYSGENYMSVVEPDYEIISNGYVLSPEFSYWLSNPDKQIPYTGSIYSSRIEYLGKTHTTIYAQCNNVMNCSEYIYHPDEETYTNFHRGLEYFFDSLISSSTEPNEEGYYISSGAVELNGQEINLATKERILSRYHYYDGHTIPIYAKVPVYESRTDYYDLSVNYELLGSIEPYERDYYDSWDFDIAPQQLSIADDEIRIIAKNLYTQYDGNNKWFRVGDVDKTIKLSNCDDWGYYWCPVLTFEGAYSGAVLPLNIDSDLSRFGISGGGDDTNSYKADYLAIYRMNHNGPEKITPSSEDPNIYEFTLENNQDLTLPPIPEGYTYEIWELAQDGWELVNINGSESLSKVEGKIGETTTTEYAFLNRSTLLPEDSEPEIPAPTDPTITVPNTGDTTATTSAAKIGIVAFTILATTTRVIYLIRRHLKS